MLLRPQNVPLLCAAREPQGGTGASHKTLLAPKREGSFIQQFLKYAMCQVMEKNKHRKWDSTTVTSHQDGGAEWLVRRWAETGRTAGSSQQLPAQIGDGQGPSARTLPMRQQVRGEEETGLSLNSTFCFQQTVSEQSRVKFFYKCRFCTLSLWPNWCRPSSSPLPSSQN